MAHACSKIGIGIFHHGWTCAHSCVVLAACSVLERYPTNGKLLKVWGRYLEFVRNDPGTAARYYEEAVRQGTAESMLAMTAGQGGTDGLAAMGTLNERVDGLIIINAQGVILMVNAACLDMFGYDKGELEGKNVSTLM